MGPAADLDATMHFPVHKRTKLAEQDTDHTWLAYVRANASFSGLRSLNCRRPSSPSSATVSWAASVGMISCTQRAAVKCQLVDADELVSAFRLGPGAHLYQLHLLGAP